MATVGLSWWFGLALAPTVATRLLATSTTVTFVGCAFAAAGAALSFMRLEARLPPDARLTPRPCSSCRQP
jgi:hypothetical protein